jgi:hypothetical protein
MKLPMARAGDVDGAMVAVVGESRRRLTLAGLWLGVAPSCGSMRPRWLEP